MFLHPSILFLHGRGVFKEVVCLKDEDEVEVLLEGEVMEPEREVDVDIFELVDVKDVDAVVERRSWEEDNCLCLDPLCILTPLFDVDS